MQRRIKRKINKDRITLITISLCMIVKNEEDTLARCLESVKDIVDEIIIVDTGSTDNTKEIISKYSNRMYEFSWIDDFAAARNFSFLQAEMEYILWLDADDILQEDDQKKLKKLKESLDPSIDSVSMNYILEHDSSGNPISSLRRNRLVKREKNYQWHGPVHEHLEVTGKIFNSDISITHSSIHHDYNRNLKIYEHRLQKGEEFSARDLFYFANELFDHQHYERAIEVYQQFLQTKKGWIEDNISACGSLADCFHQVGDQEKELSYILKSFEYDAPRAEFCCRMGYFFLKRKQPSQAIFWYQLATQLEKPSENWGRINHACWSWLPHLMLCICYTELDMVDLAYEHNEKASSYQPNHPSIIQYKHSLTALLQQRRRAAHLEGLTSAAQIDQHFKPKAGTQPLQITFILDHMNVCGGVKMIIEYTNQLVTRGHQVNIVSYDPKPNWMDMQANYIQVQKDFELSVAIPETDIIVTTFWKQMWDVFDAKIAPIIHFEQGDKSLFEFDNYSQRTKEEIKSYWAVPIPIITVSSALAAQIEKNVNRKPQVINNAVNSTVFYPSKENRRKHERSRVLFVGPEQWSFKGITDILTAIKIVNQSGYEIEPVWVTQIPPESNFQGTLYLNPAQEQLGEIYRTSDLYVCGSYYESFCLPALEAMTCGCPVISTRNPGVLEYAVNGYNCMLTTIGDPNDLAKTIIELLDNDGRRADLVKGGIETAKKFSIEKSVEKLEKYLYSEVVLE